MSISREEITQALRQCKSNNPNLTKPQLRQAMRQSIIQFLKDNKDRLGGVNPSTQPIQNPTTGWPIADAILDDLDSYRDYV